MAKIVLSECKTVASIRLDELDCKGAAINFEDGCIFLSIRYTYKSITKVVDFKVLGKFGERDSCQRIRKYMRKTGTKIILI